MLIFPLKECSPVTAPVLALVENTGSVILWNTLLCKKYSQKSEQKQKILTFLHWCWLPKMFSVLLSLQFLQFSNCSFVSNWSRWMGCNFQGQIKIWLSWKATENWTNVKFCQKQKHNQRSDEKFNFVKSKSIFNQRSDQPPDGDSISCSGKFQPCFGFPLLKLNTLKFLRK